MNIDFPIFVERRAYGTEAPRYHVRPLFFDGPSSAHADLNQALGRLGQKILGHLADLKGEQNQERLAAFTFCPEIFDEGVNLTLRLSERTFDLSLLFASFKAMGTRVAFAPKVPELWFTIQKGETLSLRASDLLTKHFKEQEKRGARIDADEFGTAKKSWITTIPMDVNFTIPKRPEKPPPFVFLGDSEPISGARELARVGRCLEFGYPDSLERAILRDAEVAELERLLEAPTPRPVLLLGPPGVGKTAVLHESIHHKMQNRRRQFADRGSTWWLSPQRLISGMSYVGQWENRALAILQESKLRRHVLYFDDFIGLYSAGTHSRSDLGVAHVLKPFVERGEVRVLAEMTHEQHRVFQELDRGFSDMFHVIRIKEPPRPDVVRMLLRVLRREEDRHKCAFEPEALSLIMELTGRHMRGSVFPGKAANFTQQVAAKLRGSKITRNELLREFQSRTGLSLNFLDSHATLQRKDVARQIGERVIAQKEAVEAMARCVSIAKARLNDPTRPLGVFLFLGPTGVGKTQAAKALATALFGSEERLVRFDMNEYADYDAPSRLTGTWANPEGLLTSAVARQPFCVVLLDEIEKAHPSAYDLLLQAIGEGRLTDSLGRTADFTHAIIIMTSNLGSREAGTRGGFRGARGDGENRAAIFRQAAQQFFRPEFFNRIDAVVPFDALERSDIEKIAEGLIKEVFSREGLARRKCALDIHPGAMARIVDRGYDPELGARALKRTIEREIAQVLAGEFCGWSAQTPTLIHVLPANEQQRAIELRAEALVPLNAHEREEVILSAETVAEIAARVKQIEKELARFQPKGAVALEEIDPSHKYYFVMREQLRHVQQRVQRLQEQLAPRRRPAIHGRTISRSRSFAPKLMRTSELQRQALFSAQDLSTYVREAVAQLSADQVPAEDNALETCAAELRLPAAMVRCAHKKELIRSRVLMRLTSLKQDRSLFRAVLAQKYAETLGSWIGLASEDVSERVAKAIGAESALSLTDSWVLVNGPHAAELLKREAGMHLTFSSASDLLPIRVELIEIRESDDFVDIARKAVSGSRAHMGTTPIVRLYDKNGSLDFGSGLLCRAMPEGRDLRTFILAALDDGSE